MGRGRRGRDCPAECRAVFGLEGEGQTEVRSFSGETGWMAAPEARGRFPVGTGSAVIYSNTVTVPPAAYFFWLVRKSMQKETLDTNRIVPQATEWAR